MTARGAGGPSLRPVLMIVHSYYDEDPRVRREAEALVASGRPVRVLALRRPGDSVEGVVAGVRVRRLDVQRHQGAGLGTYLTEYLGFGLQAAVRALREHRRARFALVQVHSLPDFLAFAAVPLRLQGVPLVLDLHEAMPELFRSRFPRAANPIVQWLLRLQERASIALSAVTLSVNEARHGRLLALGAPPRKLAIVPNCPSLSRFDPGAHPSRTFAEDGTIRLVYAGAITPIYELGVVLEAMGHLRRTRPQLDLRLDLYGRGDAEPTLRHVAAHEGIADRVVFHGRIPLDAVPAALAAADIGLAPTRRDPFTELSLSTKVFEYAAMGKPVITSRLPLVERTFPAGSLALYEPGDARSLAASIGWLVNSSGERAALVDCAREVVGRRSWEEASGEYLALVERLAIDGRPSVAASPIRRPVPPRHRRQGHGAEAAVPALAQATPRR